MSFRGAPRGFPISQIPRLTENSVSAPTPSTAGRYVAWRFRATQTGRLSIDALLSHTAGTSPDNSPSPEVTIRYYLLENYQPAYGNYWAEDDAYYGYVGDVQTYRGRLLPTLQAGHEYVIELEAGDYWATAAAGDAPINMVLRIGDEYAQIGRWVQPPDQTYTFAGALDDSGYPKADGGYIAPTKTMQSYQSWSTQNGRYETYSTNVLSRQSPIINHRAARGYYELWRTFGGPTPGTQPDAIQCSWSWARRMNLWADWWDDLGAWDGGSGNYGWTGGPGICPNMTHISDMHDSSNDHYVGWYYRSAESGLGWLYYQDIYFRTHSVSHELHVGKISELLGGTGLGYGYQGSTTNPYEYYELAPYVPAINENSEDYIEWERSTCDVLKIEVAPDEDPAAAQAPSITVNWYVEVEKSYQEAAARTWGWVPAAYLGPGRTNYQQTRWNGGPGGPESFVGTETFVASYNGGVAGWWEIPQAMLEAAKQARENRLANNPYGTESAADLRFTCIPTDILSNDVPAEAVPALNLTVSRFRVGCGLAVRATVRPSRYRVFKDPGVPDITWTDDGGELDPISDGRLFL